MKSVWKSCILQNYCQKVFGYDIDGEHIPVLLNAQKQENFSILKIKKISTEAI